MAEQPAVTGLNVGLAPLAVAMAPKTTFCAGGTVAWSASVGTRWHSLQAVGWAAAMAGFGFRWMRCAPSA